MIRTIVSGSIRFRLLVLTLAAAILVLGLVQFPRASVDALPEFAPPFIEVQTEALGLSAEEVEQLITVPLEADLLNGVQDVEVIRSESMPGLSRIVMVFQAETSLYEARARVQEKLTQAHALPQVSKPPTMLQPLSSNSRLLMVSMSSDTLTPIERSVLARWVVRPRLMGIPGVANVAIWGQRERQLQVQVDPKVLLAKGATITDAQVGYEIQSGFAKGLAFRFEISNVNNTPFIRYRDSVTNEVENKKDGKFYQFGINYKL